MENGRQMDLGGRVGLVTGGASGIGYAIADRLVQLGASVLVLDLDGAGAETAALELRERHGGKAVGRQGDVTSASDVAAALDGAEQELGSVDLLVNNAGFATFSPIVDMPEEDWDSVMGVLAKGTFLCTKEFARRVIERGGPAAVVNISSLNYTAATDGLAHYCAGKAAVSQFTKVAAAELGRYGIRVNAIAPGLVRTALTEGPLTTGRMGEEFLKRTPLGRVGEPEDIAKVAALLCSSETAWITGETISVDGGTHIRGLHSYWDTLQEDQ
jgi:NAD(P)-dependent dehydrogenase (short-subunit alcohol dehydrogenase family)